MLTEDTHLANFIKDLSTDGCEPPKNAAVQIAAAITACARIFLAPKSYYYITIDGQDIIKHKGPAKQFVDADWFQNEHRISYSMAAQKLLKLIQFGHQPYN